MHAKREVAEPAGESESAVTGVVHREVSDLEQFIAQGMLLAKGVETVGVRREAAAIRPE